MRQNPDSVSVGLPDFPSPTPLDVRDRFLQIPANSRLSLNHVPTSRKAVFLDRDGVLIKDVNYLSHPGEIRVLPGVGNALRSLQECFYLIVVTNQSGIARGYLNVGDLQNIHLELLELLAKEEVLLDAIYYCPHLPKNTGSVYNTECECRKPRPGMILKASSDFGIDLRRSYLVGDKHSDITAGESAGVKSIFLSNRAKSGLENKLIAHDVPAAAEIILDDVKKTQSNQTSPDPVPFFRNPALERGSTCQ